MGLDFDHMATLKQEFPLFYEFTSHYKVTNEMKFRL